MLLSKFLEDGAASRVRVKNPRLESARLPAGTQLVIALGVLPKRFVCLLDSLSDPGRPYVGLTSHVRERLDPHNAGRSVHTARHKPWRLVAASEFADEATAIWCQCPSVLEWMRAE
jgi:predicted GIY-YIG superfamily endonuclease